MEPNLEIQTFLIERSEKQSRVRVDVVLGFQQVRLGGVQRNWGIEEKRDGVAEEVAAGRRRRQPRRRARDRSPRK